MKAFAVLYDEHIWDVYGFIGYRVKSREQAEDLAQETFERAVEGVESGRSGTGGVKTGCLQLRIIW